jgi:hypothetical protein
MVDCVHATDAGRGNPDEFGQKVRQFALDAYDVLGRADSTLDELIALHRRVWHLLLEVHGAQSTEIHRWLLAVRQEIGAKLQSWSLEDLECLVA